MDRRRRGQPAGLVDQLRVLAQGQLLGIYPEGTRTLTAGFYRGEDHRGPGLALEARVPVIPCAMVGGRSSSRRENLLGSFGSGRV